jgi:manganese-dependent inorganic pyrophosphatase
MGQSMEPGDIVVIGDRPRGQRRAIELGAGVLVVSNGVRPEDEILKVARERGTAVLLSPLDSYVTSRLIQLSVPCWEVMSENPLTVRPDDLLTEITEQVMEVHYRAAIAVDEKRVPIGVVTRTEARTTRRPRRDRAERSRRREGRGRRDPGPPPHRRHRDELSHPRHLRSRRLNSHTYHGTL